MIKARRDAHPSNSKEMKLCNMRTKKSLLAMMMAAACLFSMAAPMNAGATANCDLNEDGDVDVLDVIVII